MSLFAVPAYLGFTACLAALSPRLPTPAWPAPAARHFVFALGRVQTRLAGIPALAIFFFVPPGSLPPFVPSDLGMLFAFSLLALTLFLLGAPSREAKESALRTAGYGFLPVAAAGFFLAWIAFTRGFPGAALNLGTFAATPLWSVMGGTGRAGLVAMSAALLFFAGSALPFAGGSPFAWHALRLGIAQILIALLFPLAPSRTGFPAMPAAALWLDFLWNWLFVFLLAHAVFPLAARCAKRAAPAWILLCIGIALCATDTIQ